MLVCAHAQTFASVGNCTPISSNLDLTKQSLPYNLTRNCCTTIYIYMYISPRIRDAGIAIESSGGAYVYISDDIGWVVSVVAVPGLGTSRGGSSQGPCVNPVN